MNQSRILKRINQAEKAMTRFTNLCCLLALLSVAYFPLSLLPTPLTYFSYVAGIILQGYICFNAIRSYKLWLACYHNKYAQAGYALKRESERRINQAP